MSKKFKMEYTLLTERAETQMIVRANLMIGDGWRPMGGVATYQVRTGEGFWNTFFTQTMVRYVPTTQRLKPLM